MAASKAARNSQSVDRLDELDVIIAAMQAQIDELGGGMFRLLSLQGGQIAAGASGTVLNKSIADVSGATVMRVRYLLTGSTTAETGITINTDKGLLYTGDLSDSTPAISAATNQFGVSVNIASMSPSQFAGVLNEVNCTSFQLIKNTGNTAQPIDWVVEYGVVE